MAQVEKDLGTRLDWVAVDHFNTGHPHTHIVVRGVDELGQNLVIAREYMSRGIAARAAELVNLDLGPRTDREILDAGRREITQERFTSVDGRLLAGLDADGLASAWHADPAEQGLHATRLGTLARMGLATEEGKGRYRLDSGLETSLRAMGRRGDIIATMHHQLRGRGDVLPHDYAIFDPASDRPIVGEVVARGLADEHADRHYAIVAATDGRSHYVEFGIDPEAQVTRGQVVRITGVPITVRDVDRIVAEVAAANDGHYSVDLHLAHDPSATERFAEAHVRRLEAVRRGGGGVERLADGRWTTAPDHLKRALAYERGRAAREPVRVETLADRPLEQLARHDGVTWLDEQVVAEPRAQLAGAFGSKVRDALDLRRQWQIEQGLAWGEGEGVRYRQDMLETLRQRELRQVAGQLSHELGLAYAEHRGGEIEGICRKAVQVGTARYAVIEKSKEFTLVPWRPVLEKHIGRAVSGIDRGGSISWSFGRQRGGAEIG